MVRRQQPEDDLEFVQDDAIAGAAAMPQPRREPDRVPAWLRFTRQGDGVFGGVREYTEDREKWRRTIIGATDARGVFDVEVRNKSQAIIRRGDTIEVAPESLTGAQAAAAAQPQPAAQTQIGTAAAAAEDVAHAFRAFDNIRKEIQPPAPAVTLEDVSRVVEQKLEGAFSKLAEVLKPAQQQAVQPADPQEQLIRMVNTLKALGVIHDKGAQTDPVAQVIELMTKTRELKESIGGDERDDDDSFLGRAGRFVEKVGNSAPKLAPLAPLVTSMLPGRMQALLAGQGVAVDGSQVGPAPAAQPQGQQPPAAQPQPAQPQTAADYFQLIIAVGVNDLTKNKRVGRLADLIEEARARCPDLVQPIDELIAASPAEVLALLEAQSGHNVASYGHALEWVGDLQSELSDDDDEDDAAQEFEPHAGSRNGTAEAAAT